MTTKTMTTKTTTADKKHFSIMPFDTTSYSYAPALDYVGLQFNDPFNCYEPPINRFALAQLPSQNAQHCGILHSRANMISSDYDQGGLSKMDMRALALNLIMFGDAAVLKVRNLLGKVVRLVPLSSLYLRVCRDGSYKYLMRKSLTDMTSDKVFEYAPEDVIMLKLYDPLQQIYGTPDYIGGIQSALLNSDATVFRRRYFANGAHMGFILYSTDPDMTEEMEDEIAESIANAKGVGNFKSMFVNIAGGHPDGLKVIPIGDTGTKDEFGTIKNISAQDILTAHRYPAGLAGVISQSGSFGDPLKIREAYRQDEVIPMQELICDAINNDVDIQANKALKLNFTARQIAL